MIDQITFFDFDCRGPDWRVFDLATFRWSLRLNDDDNQRWWAFLEGYMEHRRVSDVDLEAVPLFVPIRHIWLLGLHTANAAESHSTPS